MVKHLNITLLFSLIHTPVKYIYSLLYNVSFYLFLFFNLSLFFVFYIFNYQYFLIVNENFKQNSTVGECVFMIVKNKKTNVFSYIYIKIYSYLS